MIAEEDLETYLINSGFAEKYSRFVVKLCEAFKLDIEKIREGWKNKRV